MTLSATFLSSLNDCTGFCRDPFIAAHQYTASISVRINIAKVPSSEILFTPQIKSDLVPWCNNAFYLCERPSFTLDPLFHGGAYYVQEASSMFIHHVLHMMLGTHRNLNALDLCAAPGGKTTLLASLPHFKLILANEIIQSRVSPLVENVIKWGADHVVVSNNDPRDIEQLGDSFDVVIVDAPCSGSGLFRKDEAAQKEWSPEHVSSCSMRQIKILESASKVIREGGILLYSTCSFSKQENEDVVDALLESGMYESIFVPILPEWGIVESVSEKHGGYGYRFYPDRLKGEGFFCAALRKVSSDSHVQMKGDSSELTVIKDLSFLDKWISFDGDEVFYQKEGDVYMCKENNLSELLHMKNFLKLKRSGLRVGELIRNELIPDHELAMSAKRSEKVPRIDLSLSEALKFLRRDTIQADINFSGWGLVQHEQVVLGWVKVVNQRIKNHYPMSWRILMRA